MLVDSGGGGGSPLKANTARIRATAVDYAGMSSQLASSSKQVASSSQELAGQVVHPAVGEALALATAALGRRLAAVTMGMAHCDANLTATAASYDETDTAVATRLVGGHAS